MEGRSIDVREGLKFTFELLLIKILILAFSLINAMLLSARKIIHSH